jgi:hypothetical protein
METERNSQTSVSKIAPRRTGISDGVKRTHLLCAHISLSSDTALSALFILSFYRERGTQDVRLCS